MVLRIRNWIKEDGSRKKLHKLAFSGCSDSVIYMYRRQSEVIKGKANYGIV